MANDDYDNITLDAPAVWIDVLFCVIIIGIDAYYIYRFTDYSLHHLSRQIAKAHRNTTSSPNRKTSINTHHNDYHFYISTPSMRKLFNNGDDTNNMKSSRSTTPQVPTAATTTPRFRGGAATTSTNISDVAEPIRDILQQNSTPNLTPLNSMRGVSAHSVMASSSTILQLQDHSSRGGEHNNNNSTVTVQTVKGEATRLDRLDSGVEKEVDDVEMTRKLDFLELNNYEEMKLLIEKYEKYINNVEYLTLGRQLTGRPNTNCCCCLPYSHYLFSWSRTEAVRIFLKFWILLSSSLAFVLWIEFFGNWLLEACYFVFCFVLFRLCFSNSCF